MCGYSLPSPWKILLSGYTGVLFGEGPETLLSVYSAQDGPLPPQPNRESLHPTRPQNWAVSPVCAGPPHSSVPTKTLKACCLRVQRCSDVSSPKEIDILTSKLIAGSSGEQHAPGDFRGMTCGVLGALLNSGGPQPSTGGALTAMFMLT